MTSCCVVSSSSATRPGVGGGAFRTGCTPSAGPRPAAACASRTRVSTRHHSSYLCWSLQTRPISGRVSRPIPRLPPATRQLVAPRAPVSRRRDAVGDGPYCSPEEPMLRRGTHLLTRARERIRAAREHDPHAWPQHHPDDDAYLDDGTTDHADDSDRPPLGSPEPGAPDLDGPIGPGGGSGPPAGAGPRREDADRRRRPARRLAAAEEEVPRALRVAAAWSWRLIGVVAGVFL